MAEEPFLESIDGKHPSIVHCSNGVCLFQFRTKRDPSKHAYVMLNGQHYFDDRFEEDALFVANLLTNEWVPIPKPPYAVLHGGAVGFISQADSTGTLERFLVIEYQPLSGSNRATLMCFCSDTGKWVTKSANYMVYSHQWGCDGAFEFDGRLFWADMESGLIVWDDPFGDLNKEEKVKCRFILFPRPSCKQVFVGGGFIQCVQMSEDGEGYIGSLSLLRLKDIEGEGEWGLARKVSFFDIWSDESYLACGLTEVMPTCCFIHPWDSDVVFFHIGGWIFSLNVLTKKVESCGEGYTSIIEHVFVIPYVLPTGSTSLPPCMKATFLKEQGNSYFKAENFNEAITCYSRSIALSHNALAYANRTMAYLKVGRYHEAEVDCTEALKLDGEYFKAYARRAIARKEVGDLIGYVEDAEYALKLKPDDQEIKELYAEVKSSIEKVRSSRPLSTAPPVRDDSSNLQENGSEGEHVHEAASYAKEQGDKHFKAGKYCVAISCYTRSIALSPSAVAYANRAMAYLMISRFHEAEGDCTQSLNLDPMCSDAYRRRAIAKKKLANHEGSLEDLDMALELEHDKALKKQHAELKSLLEKAIVTED